MDPVLARLEPSVAAWFARRFGALTEAQAGALPAVLAGRSVLVSSPTGSGKTLAGFLGVFDHLARRRREAPGGPGGRGVAAVYLSPLRALAYDLAKNLHGPLAELGWADVTVAIRTGDTSTADRAAQRRRPPDILVTTPESLTVLLAQPLWRAAFAPVRFLIVDELHALAENKRGTLVCLAAERLEDLRPPGGPPLVRVGLSATVQPLPLLGEFLTGGRPCTLVAAAPPRTRRIEVYTPLRSDPYPVSGYTGHRLIRELARLITARRTTLVFCNTRGGAESTGIRLKEACPDLADRIEVHHASLDRALRLEVEDRLKEGALRAVVCSTSLELGIDIGSVDLVVLLSAPKGVARAIQRVGRSGHAPGSVSHGVLVATNINDLAECAVTAGLMRAGRLEALRPPENALDVLAQHLVGLAVEGGYTPAAALAHVRRAWPYRELTEETLDEILRYLGGGGRSLERAYAATFGKVTVVDGRLALVHPRLRRDYLQNVGTIPSEPLIAVRLGTRTVGTVEESFLQRLVPGDVFVLGGNTYRLVEVRLLAAKVERAVGALPSVPRWNANKMPLASGVAEAVVALRTELDARLAPGGPASAAAAAAWVTSAHDLARSNARALVRHFLAQRAVSEVPVAGRLLIEIVADDPHRHVFVHSLIGRSANDALSRILAWRIRCLRGGNALVTIDDYGLLLTLRPEQVPSAADWPALLAREGAEDALSRALEQAELVKWQFRGVAQTGLMVPRLVRGEQRGARSLQWSAEILFDVLRRHEPTHPLLREAEAEARLRFLDLPRALAFLEGAARQELRLRPLARISPFAFGLYASRIKETMTLEDPDEVLARLFHDTYAQAAPPWPEEEENGEPPSEV